MVGEVEVQTVVAQGCRPIGPPMTVTRADGKPSVAPATDPRPSLATDVAEKFRALATDDVEE